MPRGSTSSRPLRDSCPRRPRRVVSSPSPPTSCRPRRRATSCTRRTESSGPGGQLRVTEMARFAESTIHPPVRHRRDVSPRRRTSRRRASSSCARVAGVRVYPEHGAVPGRVRGLWRGGRGAMMCAAPASGAWRPWRRRAATTPRRGQGRRSRCVEIFYGTFVEVDATPLDGVAMRFLRRLRADGRVIAEK